MKKIFYAILMVSFLPFAAGCTTSVLGGSNAAQQQSMAQANYAAADMLIQQSKSLITPDTAVLAGTLSDMDHPAEMTAFGRVVVEQAAARFVQLGYNVSLQDNMAGGGGPAVTITGQYARAKKSVLISLRLMETQTGRLIAAHDYSLPLGSDVRELTKTAAEKNSLFGF